VSLSVSQYAEAPLAFFAAFGLAQLTLLDQDPQRTAHASLAGLSFGLALLTKNEGLLLVLCVLLARAAILVRLYGRSRLRELGWLAFGIAAPIALLLWFRAVLTPDAPMSDLHVDGWGELAARLADGSRYEVVGRYLLMEVLSPGEWPVPISVALGALTLAAGRSHGRGAREARGTVIGMAVSYGLGIFVVYVAGSTFGGLLWDHVESSLPRLMMSAWPTIVLGLFVGTRELFAGARAPSS
jgi:4-amino-4-deoxy-L-arabinose transferase-like glycosyltransferase